MNVAATCIKTFRVDGIQFLSSTVLDDRDGKKTDT